MVLFCTNRNKSEFEMCHQKQILWSSSRFRSSYILNYCYHNALQNTNTSEVSSWRKQIQHKNCYFSGFFLVFSSILNHILDFINMYMYSILTVRFIFIFFSLEESLVSCSICIFWKETERTKSSTVSLKPKLKDFLVSIPCYF